MRPILAALALASLLIAVRPLRACLWDTDTLAAEARGMPDVIRAITGRFERNPPLYYEIRLKNSAAKVAAQPSDLASYDDAGVAADRLGRSDEAIAWMEKKQKQLDAIGVSDDLAEHRYRTLANLGTFRVHRWARSGADRARIGEVKAGRDLIAAAIALKPDAHFGREGYQLKVLDTLLAPPALADGKLPPLLRLDDPANRTDDAVRGLTGLIVLGDAWESVDLFATLAQVVKLDSDRSSVAMLAELRADQSIDAGRRSLLPGAPTDPAALKLAVMHATRGEVVGGPQEKDDVVAAFRTLRAEAESWRAERDAFMIPRLQAGRHPDTDPTFWDGYVDRPPPPIPGPATSVVVARTFRRRVGWDGLALGGGAVAAVVGLGVVGARWRGRRRAGI